MHDPISHSTGQPTATRRLIARIGAGIILLAAVCGVLWKAATYVLPSSG